jgi:hypothetical protein
MQMPGTIVQFLATREEILEILDWFRGDREMVIAAGHFSEPGELILLIPHEPIEWVQNSTFFYLKLGTRFSEENSLFVHTGASGECIRESSAGLKGEGPEFDYWKKRLSKLKRTFRKGAYLASPYLDSKTYYKNTYYTDGAKAAYDRGVKLMQVAGNHHYLLEAPEA